MVSEMLVNTTSTEELFNERERGAGLHFCPRAKKDISKHPLSDKYNHGGRSHVRNVVLSDTRICNPSPGGAILALSPLSLPSPHSKSIAI